MSAENSLDALEERFEKLMLRRSRTNTLSEDHRRRIADKFANKTLQELHEIVCQLDDNANSTL